LATPNYSYEKRQRELAKKKKKEEKNQRKVNKPDGSPDEGQPVDGSAGQTGTPGSDTPPSAA
jgi:hypothetical protein